MGRSGWLFKRGQRRAHDVLLTTDSKFVLTPIEVQVNTDACLVERELMQLEITPLTYVMERQREDDEANAN